MAQPSHTPSPNRPAYLENLYIARHNGTGHPVSPTATTTKTPVSPFHPSVRSPSLRSAKSTTSLRSTFSRQTLRLRPKISRLFTRHSHPQVTETTTPVTTTTSSTRPSTAAAPATSIWTATTFSAQGCGTVPVKASPTLSTRSSKPQLQPSHSSPKLVVYQSSPLSLNATPALTHTHKHANSKDTTSSKGSATSLSTSSSTRTTIRKCLPTSNSAPQLPGRQDPDGLDCERCYYFVARNCKGYVIGGETGDACEGCAAKGFFGAP